MTILHLDSSIQGEASASRVLSRAVVDRLIEISPGETVEYRDLVADPLAHLTLDAFAGEEARAVLAQFHRADTVVVGTAFYNFTVSSQLKAWIDRILVAGETFRYGEGGKPEGLAGAKRVIVALSRGGVYATDSANRGAEHAETWLRTVFGFMGITNIEFVIAEGLAYGPEARTAAIDGAVSEARQLRAA